MAQLENFVRLNGTPEEIKKLGPLAGLAGKWVGTKGFNLVAVPRQGSMPDDQGAFELLVQPYTETIEFTPIGGKVRNRGGAVDQFIYGLLYTVTVSDLETNATLHVENGQWLNLSDIVKNKESADGDVPFPIARTACIPHGNTALILGNFETVPSKPRFPKVSVIPDAGPDATLGYTSGYHPVGNFEPADINSVLRSDIKALDVIKTTTFSLDSDSKNQGGILNIPFITKFANATRFQATFWLETVKSDEGELYQLLQYSQVIDLEFHKKFGECGLITWPHSTVNTLRKV